MTVHAQVLAQARPAMSHVRGIIYLIRGWRYGLSTVRMTQNDAGAGSQISCQTSRVIHS